MAGGAGGGGGSAQEADFAPLDGELMVRRSSMMGGWSLGGWSLGGGLSPPIVEAPPPIVEGGGT